jgi:chemotaxis protein MotA
MNTMDRATILGLTLGGMFAVTAMVISGSPVSAFFDFSALLCVVGGVLCAVLIGLPVKAIRQVPQVIWKALAHRPADSAEIMAQLVRLAEVARREGLLAVDKRLEGIRHAFLRLGVQMVVDGTRPEVIDEILRAEIDAIAARHALGRSVVDQAGRYAPAFGMIGTLFGLVMMLHRMSDPSNLGSGMAVALLTTLYGVLFANVVCLPISAKLAHYQREEIVVLELIVKGVLAMQAGENPRLIEQKLRMPRSLTRQAA